MVILAILFVCFVALCYAFFKGVQKVYYHYFKPKNRFISNPYIEAHILRHRNDKDYDDYLNWLDETGGDLPIKKVLTREEWEFQKQLNI